MWNHSPYSMAASEMLPSEWLTKWLSRYENSTNPHAKRTCRTPMPRRNLGRANLLRISIKLYAPVVSQHSGIAASGPAGPGGRAPGLPDGVSPFPPGAAIPSEGRDLAPAPDAQRGQPFFTR